MHYWMPIAEGRGARHAFYGRHWDGRKQDITVCGQHVSITRPDEMDWILYPTCMTCWKNLAEEGEASTNKPQRRW
ncbi:hypothetical protein [Saccharopolyspora rectivirgula]|uniref:hypothetical protein n=1 Tax=Saccharopolyspora rectivirgula TaxID=28042 RepID=UPI000A8E4986|nr:hypothetical protein [Saccharopolyspora rectivirgula]MDD6757859.1 hypothetical protein [bacterium]